MMMMMIILLLLLLLQLNGFCTEVCISSRKLLVRLGECAFHVEGYGECDHGTFFFVLSDSVIIFSVDRDFRWRCIYLGLHFDLFSFCYEMFHLYEAIIHPLIKCSLLIPSYLLLLFSFFAVFQFQSTLSWPNICFVIWQTSFMSELIVKPHRISNTSDFDAKATRNALRWENIEHFTILLLLLL